MPPHCDTRDGPVVRACRKALETGNVNYALIWIPPAAEPEVKTAFERTMKVRETGDDARGLADDWFFETVVRLHRAGEGAPYTGLKPAGLDEGPVVPRAEQAIETEDPTEVTRFILHAVEADLLHRFQKLIKAKRYKPDNVKAGRAFIQAYLDFVVYSHHLHQSVTGAQVDRGHEHH